MEGIQPIDDVAQFRVPLDRRGGDEEIAGLPAIVGAEERLGQEGERIGERLLVVGAQVGEDWAAVVVGVDGRQPEEIEVFEAVGGGSLRAISTT